MPVVSRRYEALVNVSDEWVTNASIERVMAGASALGRYFTDARVHYCGENTIPCMRSSWELTQREMEGAPLKF